MDITHNPEENDLQKAFGISDERFAEFTELGPEWTKELLTVEGVSLSSTFEKLANWCQNNNELVYFMWIFTCKVQEIRQQVGKLKKVGKMLEELKGLVADGETGTDSDDGDTGDDIADLMRSML